MTFYTNVIPVIIDSGLKEERSIPIGSTFSLVGVDGFGLRVKAPKSFGDGHLHIHAEIFKMAFKELDIDGIKP